MEAPWAGVQGPGEGQVLMDEISLPVWLGKVLEPDRECELWPFLGVPRN